MYQCQIPPEILRAEKPGILGFSLFQILGMLLGFYVASSISSNIILIGIGVVAGAVLARKRQGIYMIQSVWYWVIWQIEQSQGGDETMLSPDQLYQQSDEGDRDGVRTTYVVRTPDGSSYTLER